MQLLRELAEQVSRLEALERELTLLGGYFAIRVLPPAPEAIATAPTMVDVTVINGCNANVATLSILVELPLRYPAAELAVHASCSPNVRCVSVNGDGCMPVGRRGTHAPAADFGRDRMAQARRPGGRPAVGAAGPRPPDAPVRPDEAVPLGRACITSSCPFVYIAYAGMLVRVRTECISLRLPP